MRYETKYHYIISVIATVADLLPVPLTSQKRFVIINSTCPPFLGLFYPPSPIARTIASPRRSWAKKTICLHARLLPNHPPPTTIGMLLFNKFCVNSILLVLSVQQKTNHLHPLQKTILRSVLQNLMFLRKILLVVVVVVVK